MKREGGFVPIPERLEAKPKFLLWDLDSVVIFTVGLFFGVLIGSVFAGIGFGCLLTYFWTKARRGQAEGLLMHSFYWYLPLKTFKRLPPSCVRDFQK